MTSAAQQLVDIGYGPNSNLYKDVLKVSRNASKEDIQSAFVDRRFELYGILQNTSSSSSSSSSVVDDSTGGGSGSKISLSERQFTEKKMDALVATFRILYDPAKRLEYNAKLDSTTTTTTSTASKKSTKNSNRSTRSSTITIKQQQQQQQTRTAESSSKITKGGSNETSTSIASGCSRSSTASSLNSSKSKTRRQGLSTAKGGEQRAREAMEASTKNRDEVPSSKSGGGKRSSDKRIGRPQKNNTKQTIHKAPSSNLPSTKLKSPKSAIRANTASNSFSSLREATTGSEPILKRVENGSSQQQQQQQQQSQPLREVENIMGGTTTTNKKLKKGLRTDKHPPSNVSHAQAAANAAIENNVLGIPRTKSTVSWKDGTKNTPPKKKQTTTTSSSSSEQIDVDDIDANSCFLMDYEDRSNTAELVESKNSFSGFLRSSGYENQAYLVEELGNEVRGLTADTLLAVDQVLNAFKIGDDDIDAIVGNIREEKDCLAKHIRY